MGSWEAPSHSRTQVAKAGKDVAQLLKKEEASFEERRTFVEKIGIINNFRASHAFPLNTFQIALRKTARNVDENAVVAQRLKRMPTILDKLERYPQMNLSRMQDIGGCRAIVDNIEKVGELYKNFQSRKAKHQLANTKDYISEPKSSGYRGIHLVYKYHSDRNDTYNNLNIEIQIRTRLQHSWATAVETAGMLLKQHLKSSQGEDDWLEFFKHASSAFSYIEGTPPLHNSKSQHEVIQELRRLSNKIHAFDLLQAVSDAMQLRDNDPQLTNAGYYILVVDTSSNELTVYSYKRNESAKASREYSEIENRHRDDDNTETVMVAVESINTLKSAYPNYYGDASAFLQTLRNIIA